jgi:sporulation protein YlmC with PRC-barrel domain
MKTCASALMAMLFLVILGLSPLPAGAQSMPMPDESEPMPSKSAPMMKSSSMGMGTPFEGTHRASRLIGAEVTNSRQEELGRIDDLVVDPDGRVSYLILSRGGIMGVGGDRIAVPVSAAQPRLNEEGRCIVALDKQTLDAAPSFASNQWPDLSSPGWQDEVRGYFRTGEGGAQ